MTDLVEAKAPVRRRRGRKPKEAVKPEQDTSKAALHEEQKPELKVVTKPDPWAKWRDEMQDDFKMVKGIFKNYENPGMPITFCTRKYKGEPVRWWSLKDGEVAEIPLYVAKHLNANCWWPIHEHALDPVTNRPLPIIGSQKHRTGFQGLEFHDTAKYITRHPA